MLCSILLKYFYDVVGFVLFDCICELFEYYLMCIEFGILCDCVVEIVWCVGLYVDIVEFGVGLFEKICVLFDVFVNNYVNVLVCYVLVDIFVDYLYGVVVWLWVVYLWFDVVLFVVDYMKVE